MAKKHLKQVEKFDSLPAHAESCAPLTPNNRRVGFAESVELTDQPGKMACSFI